MGRVPLREIAERSAAYAVTREDAGATPREINAELETLATLMEWAQQTNRVATFPTISLVPEEAPPRPSGVPAMMIASRPFSPSPAAVPTPLKKAKPGPAPAITDDEFFRAYRPGHSDQRVARTLNAARVARGEHTVTRHQVLRKRQALRREDRL